MYTVNHDYNGRLLPYDDNYIKRPVRIGRNVWIGFGVTILPGSVIEDGAIIGAGTTVAGRVLKGDIIGGSIGKVIKSRDMHHYGELDKSLAYSGHGGRPIGSKDYKVITLSEDKLRCYAIDLANRVRDDGFIPDLIIGIRTGGEHVASIVSQAFSGTQVSIVKRQRHGTNTKRKLKVGKLLKILPYKVSDRLRVLEHRLLERNWQCAKPEDVRNSTLEECSGPLSSNNFTESRILIVDDAVYSGTTMYNVYNFVRSQFKDAEVRTFTIALTMRDSLIRPDYVAISYGNLVRFHWSEDYHGVS